MVTRGLLVSLAWGIAGSIFILVAFYLIQVLGMQDWEAPVEFMLDKWYFVAPLVVGFGTQAGLFHTIHQRTRHGGGGAMAGSGGVSGGAMLACCMHNLILLFPILGVSGLATFFAAYQSQVFLVSIAVVLMGVGYMLRKHRDLCKTYLSRMRG
ncbi:MAG: hypothetical protein NUV84_02600 [Candidatus Uhrbacteria bacterium]|nr:hypothetical protein [Candidatus Uhrbacteria bacterium]